MIELKLPELGEDIKTAEVSRLLVSEGDPVTAGQSVLELESEKASFPLPCPSAGRIGKIRVKVGDTVSIGQTVLELDDSAASKPTASGDGKKRAPAPEAVKPKEETVEKTAPASAEKKASRDTEEAKPNEDAEEKSSPGSDSRDTDEAEDEATTTPAPAGAESSSSAGPATRRLARELGVDLNEVPGSERGGRITRDDVKAFVKERMNRPRERGADVLPPLPDFSRFGPVRRQPLSKLGRTAAERLSLAWRTIPHVTQHATADITDLEAGRRRFNEEHRDAAPKITMTALAIRAAAAALRAYPRFNSSLDMGAGELILKDYCHIGIAVDTEAGLLVPVVRDADKKSLVQLAAELAELADKARKRELAPKEMEGGTFTITNLGGIGGSFFTPIINHPETAILGIGQAEQNNSDRLRLPLSLSYDHRVINGADGARFIRTITNLLADPFRLLAEM